MHIFIVVSKFGLHSIGAEQNCCFRWAVDLIAEDPFLHLQEEELLGNVLDQLLRDILREELGTESELKGAFLPDFLSGDLNRLEKKTTTTFEHSLMDNDINFSCGKWFGFFYNVYLESILAQENSFQNSTGCSPWFGTNSYISIGPLLKP